MKLYSDDVLEEFMDDPKCEECGDLATQRCSKCKTAWHCSRDCQLRQWKKHKPICKMFAEAKAKTEEAVQTQKESIRDKAEKQANQKQGGKRRPLIEELN